MDLSQSGYEGYLCGNSRQNPSISAEEAKALAYEAEKCGQADTFFVWVKYAFLLLIVILALGFGLEALAGQEVS